MIEETTSLYATQCNMQRREVRDRKAQNKYLSLVVVAFVSTLIFLGSIKVGIFAGYSLINASYSSTSVRLSSTSDQNNIAKELVFNNSMPSPGYKHTNGTETEPPQGNSREVSLHKAFIKAIGGGIPGAIAGVVQVLTLMWIVSIQLPYYSRAW